MLSQNERGGNYFKFNYFVRENHKPEGKLMGETLWGELGTKSTEQKKRSSVFM